MLQRGQNYSVKLRKLLAFKQKSRLSWKRRKTIIRIKLVNSHKRGNLINNGAQLISKNSDKNKTLQKRLEWLLCSKSKEN